MDVFADIDTGLRGAVLGLMALISVRLALHDLRTPVTLAFIALAAGLAGYVVVSANGCPTEGCGGGLAWRIGVLLAMLAPAMLWWAGLELFELAGPLRKSVPVAAFAVVALALVSESQPFAGALRGVLIVCLYAHLLFMAWQSAPGDLVEARRSFRRWVMVAAALTGLTITAVELGVPESEIGPFARVLQASALFAVTLAFALWLFQVRGAFWPDSPRRADASPEPAPAVSTVAPADRAVLSRLETAMEGGIWRREGLTIGALAAEIATPEHRLRQVINRVLGYRNFALFINERRVAAAKDALRDPARADIPITTIAYDCGFGSLGPFNRAFRDITGKSPTAFRASDS